MKFLVEIKKNKVCTYILNIYVVQIYKLIIHIFQNILANAQDYIDILVFTDEPGDNPELQDAVITLAKKKKCKINVIWTEPSPSAPELQETCEQIGGKFIESSKVDVDDIVGLLSETIKTSEVSTRYFFKNHLFHHNNMLRYIF